jgi:hypothetical protein
LIEFASATAHSVSSQPMAAGWVVFPVCMLAMLVIGGHVLLIDRSDQPPVRKRVRTVNGLLMMLTIPVVGAGFGFIPPSDTRLFLMTWTLAVGLILLVLLLALLDIATSLVIHRRERAELRRRIVEARALAVAPRPAE